LINHLPKNFEGFEEKLQEALENPDPEHTAQFNNLKSLFKERKFSEFGKELKSVINSHIKDDNQKL